MPCEYYSPGEEVANAHQELNRVTRVACELVKELRRVIDSSRSYIEHLSSETREWVIEHDKMDRKRRLDQERESIQDRLKKNALSKLSPAERKALGL